MKNQRLAVLIMALLVSATPSWALTTEARAATLERIAALIEKNYVYQDKASAIAAAMRGWKNDPEIEKAADERQFAAILTERLQPKDRHFAIEWSPPKAGQGSLPSPDAAAAFERQANYGFDRVERLPGNIGYIRLSYFSDFDVALSGDKAPAARKAAEAALAFVANTDAVIFDLRLNGGGSPAMIDLLLSAFFGDKPVLLNRFLHRGQDKLEDFTTLANFSGLRRPSVPLYVLVSGRTASAAEEFTYDVQTQKRGTIIGETTAGAANPGDRFDAGEGFSIFISTGAAVNPITGTNWETVGVTPGILVDSSDALARAEAEALKTILAGAKPGTDTTEVRWSLEQAQAEVSHPATPPLTDFAGVYGDRKLFVKDGALIYKRNRAPALKLVALGGDKFGLQDFPDTRILFTRNGKGRVDSLTVTDPYGGDHLYRRTGD